MLMEKDQQNLLIIGGIWIFLPSSQDEARQDVVGTTTKGKPSETVKEEEEMGQTSRFEPVEEKEHSKEWLKIFSQEAEKKTVAALKLTARAKEENTNEFLTQWEMELRMLEDWLDHLEPTHGCKETIMISGEEHSVECLRNFGREAEQMEIAALEPAAEKEENDIDFAELHE
jgi:hypothetical protein